MLHNTHMQNAPSLGGQSALRVMTSTPQQGRNQMARYTGPDARPANPAARTSGVDNIRALLTQKREQLNPQVPQGQPAPNQMAYQHANPNAAFQPGQPPGPNPPMPSIGELRSYLDPAQQPVEGMYQPAPTDGQAGIRQSMDGQMPPAPMTQQPMATQQRPQFRRRAQQATRPLDRRPTGRSARLRRMRHQR